MSMRDNETGVLRKKRGSVLDYHIDEIKDLRKLGLNAIAIHKLMQNKIKGGISYTGMLAYLKRNNL